MEIVKYFFLIGLLVLGCNRDLEVATYDSDSASDSDSAVFGACNEVTCYGAPANSCDGAGNLVVYNPAGYCVGGTCQYMSRPEMCAVGSCKGGVCEENPCQGTFCTVPPSNSCDGDSLVAHQSEGRCRVIDGQPECVYSTETLACKNGCSVGACIDEPCVGVYCNTPPSRYCDGETLMVWNTIGHCTAGVCEYAPQEVACVNGCSEATCNGDTCTGVLCDVPPASYCSDDVQVSYNDVGACGNGFCSYQVQETSCVDVCVDGACAGSERDTDSDTSVDTDSGVDTEPDTGTLPDCVVYVDKSAQGNEDGSDWVNAYEFPQEALTAAAAAGSGCEVWVAAGTYYVRDTAATDTLTVPNGAQVYGGFDGTEVYREQRDVAANITILSGYDRLEQAQVRRVITVESGAAPTRVDGFVITGAKDSSLESGAGLFVNQGVLFVQNCTFLDNRDEARCNGGALESWDTAIEVLNCVFQNNYCDLYPYNKGGGGIFVGSNGTVGAGTVARCAFIGNQSSGHAGDGSGGAIRSDAIPLDVQSSLFVGNSAGAGVGGAIYTNGAFSVGGSTFVRNTANRSGAIQLNCCTYYDAYGIISWDNESTTDSQGGDDIGAFLNYSFSTVQGGITGNGSYNVDANPMFFDYPTAASGAWEQVDYDATKMQTTFTDDDASWTPGQYAGQALYIIGLTPQWLYIVDNTATTMTVWEEQASVVATTEYKLYDFHLKETSHCIDAGHGDYQLDVDYYGSVRYDAATADLGDGTPDYCDQGAIEWQL